MNATWFTQFTIWLHGTAVGRVPFLEHAIVQLYYLVPGTGSRYHWAELLETLLLVAWVYFSARHVQPAGGWRGFFRYCLPKRLYTHPSAIVDYQLNVINVCFGYALNLTWRVNTVAMTGLYIAGLIWALGPAPHALKWSLPMIAGVMFLVLVAEDFGGYVLHYLSHKIPFLWALHKLHHSAEVLTPLTANRVHPLEAGLIGSVRSLFSALVLAPVTYFFIGPPEPPQIFGIAAMVFVVGAMGDVLMHSHVWLSWGRRMNHVLFCPAMHQIHHSQAPRHWDRNFAAWFSVWDWMFGTLYIPDEPEEIVYGIYGEPRQLYPNVFAAWLRPLWEIIPMRERAVDAAARLFGDRIRVLALKLDLVPVPPFGSSSNSQI